MMILHWWKITTQKFLKIVCNNYKRNIMNWSSYWKSFVIKREVYVRSESKFGIILRTNRIKKLIIKGHTLYTWNFYYDIKYMHFPYLNLSRPLKVFRIYHLPLYIFANVCSQLRDPWDRLRLISTMFALESVSITPRNFQRI